jgi:predicted ATPase with chaperone activity
MDRMAKVARTIADLSGAVNIHEEHVLEAASFLRSGPLC